MKALIQLGQEQEFLGPSLASTYLTPALAARFSVLAAKLALSSCGHLPPGARAGLRRLLLPCLHRLPHQRLLAIHRTKVRVWESELAITTVVVEEEMGRITFGILSELLDMTNSDSMVTGTNGDVNDHFGMKLNAQILLRTLDYSHSGIVPLCLGW